MPYTSAAASLDASHWVLRGWRELIDLRHEVGLLRVTQVGLGWIGRALGQRVARHPDLELVAAVDPSFAGRPLASVFGIPDLEGTVAASIEGALHEAPSDLVLHATGSYLEDVAGELRTVLEHGADVVSTCEELAFPFYRHPALARELDELAAFHGAVLLGTGINPGFVMDKLVTTLMSACDSVSVVRVERVVDAALRRESFQRKIGAGIAPSVFQERKAAGRLGHVGLAESAHFLAEALGVGPERQITEELEPVLAERRISTAYLTVEVGQVAGMRQSLRLSAEGRERVRLDIEMVLGAQHPHDVVRIEGSPPLELEIASGIPGDEGTAAVVLSATRSIGMLEPGLRTMLDVPIGPATLRR